MVDTLTSNSYLTILNFDHLTSPDLLVLYLSLLISDSNFTTP